MYKSYLGCKPKGSYFEKQWDNAPVLYQQGKPASILIASAKLICTIMNLNRRVFAAWRYVTVGNDNPVGFGFPL
jgi:hypothetical protein